MRDYFADFDGQPWFTRDTQMRTMEAKAALGQKLQDAVKSPVIPGQTYDYMDDTTPPGMEREDIVLDGVKAYFYRDPVRDADQPKVILYVHGGAFICGNENYARFVGFSVGLKLGLPVLTIEYSLAPEHKLPAGLDDMERFWNWLQDERGYQPKDIIVMGDSAGAEMTIALTIRLITKGLATPSKIIPLHPAVDVVNDPDHVRFGATSHRDNVDTDQIFLGGLAAGLHDMLVAADGSQDDDPEISPICADDAVVAQFPPTYLVADDCEVLLSDSLLFAQKLAKAGVDVKLHVFHYLWHDFEVFFPDLPESEVVWAECRDFLGL